MVVRVRTRKIFVWTNSSHFSMCIYCINKKSRWILLAVVNLRVPLRASDTRCFSFMMRTAKPRRCRSCGPLRALFFWLVFEALAGRPCLEAKGQGVPGLINAWIEPACFFPHHLYPSELYQVVQCSIPIWCNDYIQVSPRTSSLFFRSLKAGWFPQCAASSALVSSKVDCDSPPALFELYPLLKTPSETILNVYQPS